MDESCWGLSLYTVISQTQIGCTSLFSGISSVDARDDHIFYYPGMISVLSIDLLQLIFIFDTQHLIYNI